MKGNFNPYRVDTQVGTREMIFNFVGVWPKSEGCLLLTILNLVTHNRAIKWFEAHSFGELVTVTFLLHW